MANIPRVGDLELEQDLDFERGEWRVERIAWVVMGLVILAAILGLFGGAGLLIKTTAKADGVSFEIEYHRFDRFKAPSLLRVRLGPGATSSDSVRLWIDGAYMRTIKIDQITPEPKSMEAASDRLVFTFELENAGDPAEIDIHFTPQIFGRLSARAGLMDDTPDHRSAVQFTQFIYP